MRRKDEKHLTFIRTLECCICGDNTSTEAAHIRFADARIGKPITGNSIKPDDRFTLPLCGSHHREQHSTNERRFWSAQGMDPVLLSLALYSVSGEDEEASRIIRYARPANILAAG